jgi:hypothetical protein
MLIKIDRRGLLGQTLGMSEESTSTPSTQESAESTSGPLSCRTTPYFARRILTIAGIVGLFSGWFLYDGLVTYPKKREIYQTYLKYKDTPEEWKTLAKNNNWEADPTEYKDYDDGKIRGQYISAAVTGIVALAAMIYFLSRRKTVLTADEDSFTTPNGTRVPFDAVRRIDLRKWQAKGLGYVLFDQEGGQGKATLDDLYYQGADKVLARLRERCRPDTEIIDYEEVESAPEGASAKTPGGEAA